MAVSISRAPVASALAEIIVVQAFRLRRAPGRRDACTTKNGHHPRARQPGARTPETKSRNFDVRFGAGGASWIGEALCASERVETGDGPFPASSLTAAERQARGTVPYFNVSVRIC